MDEETTTGTEEVEVDPKAEQREDYAAMTDARLRTKHAQLEKQFGKLAEGSRTPASLEQAREIRAQQAAIAEVLNGRAAESAEQDAEFAKLAADAPSLPALAGESAEAEGGDAPATVAVEAGAPAAAPALAQVAAARGDAAVIPAAARTRARVEWVGVPASADVVTAGSPMALDEMGRKMTQAMRSSFVGETHIAAIPALGEEFGALLSRRNSVDHNDELIAESISAWKSRMFPDSAPRARTAAICDPLDIIREIPDCGVDDAPFSDSFPFRGAGRLGFQFTRSTALNPPGSVSPTLWTDADQTGVDPDDSATWKPCDVAVCATPVETRAEEIVWCLTYDDSTEMSSPEVVRDTLIKLNRRRIRRREGYLLRRYDQLSSGYALTAPSIGAAMPDLIDTMNRVIAILSNSDRLDPTFFAWLPPDLLKALASDRARKFSTAACDPCDLSEELNRGVMGVSRWTHLRDLSDNRYDLAPLGEVPTPLIPDETTPLAPAGVFLSPAPAGDFAPTPLDAVNDLCGTFRVRIGDPSAFLAYTTGQINTGVLRDAALVRQNRSQQFGKEWLGIAKHGCAPSAYIDVTIVPSGGRVGTVAPVTACP